MSTAFKIGLAGALIAVSAGLPCILRRQAQLELLARRELFEQQSVHLLLLVEENSRLSNIVAQATVSPSLAPEQLRELLRLRNEKRWLGEQTNVLTKLAEEKIDPEDESIARERARLVLVGASLGISPEDAGRFFDRVKQAQNGLGPKVDDMRKTLTGSPEEIRRQMQAAIQVELNKLAIETLGEKGPVLVQKMIERR